MAARRSVVETLRRGATAPPRERSLRRWLVSGEVALACVLLVSVTLLGRSLFDMLAVRPGFEARGVLLLQVSVPSASYATIEPIVSFYSALQGALEERLGPRTTSVINEVPLTGDGGRTLVSARPGDAGREAVMREAGSAYFDVMRIPLVAGRSFDLGDNRSAPRRAVVSASLADRLSRSEQAVGRRIQVAPFGQEVEIVGVAGDVKHRALDEAPHPTVYLSAWQTPSRSRIVVVRSARPDADVISIVREEVARLDRDLPVYGIRPLANVVAASPGVPERRMLAAAFTGFAVLAVALAALGLFGVAAHDVASRRPELALRVALGADPRRLLSATLGQGALTVGLGLVAGGLLSIWAVRALGGMVAVTGEIDLVSIGVAAAVLAAAGAGAVLPAALRAARTDPLIALRAE